MLFLREIPLRKSHTAPVAEAPNSGTNRSRALLGLTLALVAREAQKPDANPQVLETLSNSVDGRYPHEWSDEQRGKAVAQDIIEPLAISLIASSIGNGKHADQWSNTGILRGDLLLRQATRSATDSFIG